LPWFHRCDFFIKHVTLPGNVQVALQIWDIGGQTIGSKMIGKYIFGAQAVFLAYDVSNAETFQNLEDWLALVRTNCNKDAAPILAILGNKST
jgi:Ras-related protein Rab-28